MSVEHLGVFMDVKRYLDAERNTTFVIDYQVPYKNLMFLSRNNSYFAELKVNISIANADSVLLSKDFINNIGVTRKYDVTSSGKSYIDRISITLAKPGFHLILDFEDLNANTKYSWTYVTEQLSSEERLSDIEMITNVSADTLAFSPKFKRNSLIYIPEPSALISQGMYDSVFFYCEAYDIKEDDAKAIFTLKKEGTAIQITSSYIDSSEATQPLYFPLNINNLESGRYNVSVDLFESGKVVSRDFEFFIKEQTEQLYFLFTDADDEYQLIRYIANVKSSNNWQTMTKEAKRRYISSFWSAMAAQLNQPTEDIIQSYKQRVDYTNAKYSHFEKGWKSDMGRIYIRNGPPGDVEEDTTSDETRFVPKDYQIWKYSGKVNAVYVFVDIPMNGNFKLVFARNDEQESTLPNWRRYLGTDFDESSLDN